MMPKKEIMRERIGRKKGGRARKESKIGRNAEQC